jgi:ABC-2 type transport system ATP-binding protein
MQRRNAEPVLVCRHLQKRYGEHMAVADVSFSVHRGECYGLLGPNGAGKTTTISMACGLLERDGGEVFVLGQLMDRRSVELKGAIGYVPQDLALYPELSAADNLEFFGRLYGLKGKRLAQRVEEVLGVVGLSDRARQKVGTFSGGMKRRANIAAGLLHEPALLVLDEPTVGVDPQSRNAILETVLALRDQGMAVLYTTHYMEEAERLCDRIGIIDHGRVIAEGTSSELVAMVASRGRIRVTATSDLTLLEARLAGAAGVEGCVRSDGCLELLADEPRRRLKEVVVAAAELGLELTGVEVLEPDLEAVFLELTGRELRD